MPNSYAPYEVNQNIKTKLDIWTTDSPTQSQSFYKSLQNGLHKKFLSNRDHADLYAGDQILAVSYSVTGQQVYNERGAGT